MARPARMSRSRGRALAFGCLAAPAAMAQQPAGTASHRVLGHRNTSAVDGDNVPVRHFGLVLPMAQWHALAEKLKAAGIKFVIEPHIRFKGLPGEQATMFFLDPSGNALEFKAFEDPSRLFATQ